MPPFWMIRTRSESAADEVEILLDQDHGEPSGPQTQQDLDDLLDDRRLDAFGRLVEQNELGSAAQAARQGQ